MNDDSDAPRTIFWQWLAIGVLVGCWLAEATWCIDRGF
jgi:hypothetical protein